MRRLLTPLLLAYAVATGCQQYRPSPLDLGAHAEQWAVRDPGAPGVAEYAKQLAALRDSEPVTFNPADGFSLREAEAVALFFNQRVRVARLKARVPAVGAREAGRWEDPELAIDGERIIESVDDPWVLGGMINLTIPLSGRLGVEKSRAFAEADVESLRAYGEEVAVLAELRATWATWSVAKRRSELAASYLKELDQVVGSAEALAKAGELDTADARLFRVERVTRRAELQSLQLEERQNEVAIKGLMGLVPEAQVTLVSALPAAPSAGSTEQRRLWLQDHHPRMLLARVEYKVAEKALELEIRKQYPDLSIGGGFGTDEGQSRVLFGGGIPLPLFNRNRRGIAEAMAARDTAKAAAEGSYEDLVGQLARAELATNAAMQRRQLLEREVVPLVDEQVRELRQLGRLGDFNTLVLLDALRTSYETKVQLLDAVAAQATTTNELRALVGAGVPGHAGRKDGKR